MDMMWLCRHHFLNLHMTIQTVFCSHERILFFLSIIFTRKYYAVCKDTAKLNMKESHHQKTLQVYATTTNLHSSRLLDHCVISDSSVWNAFEFPRAYRHCCCCCWFLSSAYVEVIQITGCELMVLYHPLRHKLDTPELRSHKDRYRNSLPINTRYSYIFILDLRPWLYDI